MVLDVCPAVITMARKNRRWLERAVRWLAQDVGMDQFLDVGSGLPTVENTHEVAQRYQPEATVVYCDNDPTVNAYGRALLATHPHTWFATSDLSRPDEVLRTAEVAQLDFTRPLVLMQCSTLHHVSDEADPHEVMRRYVAALPSGSYVALTHFWDPCDNGADSRLCRELEDSFAETVGSGWWRSREQISRMFDGLELVEPGLVPLADWWPSGPRLDSPEQGEHLCLAAVGRKP